MLLKVENLTKTYAQGEKTIDVLRGVSLEASPGDTIAILGQSGSGKSTLLTLLAGLDRPTGGAIRVGPQEISSMREEELSRFRSESLGIIFQQFHLMSDLRAHENVSLPLELAGRPQAERFAREALARVGLAERAEHFPRQLSGGECQRVAIARAIVARPKILLADEPTGNLDFETAQSVSELVFEVARQSGTILILVTHSEELAARCSRQYRLRHGQLQSVR